MAEGLNAPVGGLYCERLDASFWAEPTNAVSNVAFLVAAAMILAAHRGDRPLTVLAVVTFAIGVGSFLFHTFATRWALLADVVPIQIFIGLYFFLALRRFLKAGPLAAGLATAAFVAAASQLPALFPFGPWRGLGGYLGGLAGLLGVGAAVLLRSAPNDGAARATGRGLIGVALLFAVSLAFRTLDNPVCPVLPIGTHALWHVTNAIVLFALMRIFGQARLATMNAPRLGSN